MLMRTC